METWKNLQKGFTANECLSGTYVDADVWHVCTNVARLHQKASQIEKAVPHYNFGRIMGRLWILVTTPSPF